MLLRPIAALLLSLSLSPSLLAQGTVTCEPGVLGVIACPCANAPSGPGRGCNNSANTGGASLSATGVASLSGDSVQFDANFIGTTTVTCANPTGTTLSVLYQGNTPIANGIVFGDGVLCCGGFVLILSAGQSNLGNFHYPTPGTTGVSQQSAAMGDPLSAGMTRCYFVAYRDACPTFCTPGVRQKTNSYTITWTP